MPTESPIWLSRFDHLRLDSSEPLVMAQFYRDVMGMAFVQLDGDFYLVQGPSRRLLIGRGEKGAHPFSAWMVSHLDQLTALRKHAEQAGLKIEPCPSPLFEKNGFAVRDPDGRLAVFGLPASNLPAVADFGLAASRLPARLQHAVVATTRLEEMRAFYQGRLGFILSDTVYDNQEGEPLGKPTIHFFRADNEHHSLAVFTGSTSRHDHHCYETTCWNDLRDWLDFLGQLDIAPWWGPGRHGPGANLFFMIKDPDGNNIEISAELEVMSRVTPPRAWPNSRRMYNLWGTSWNRD